MPGWLGVQRCDGKTWKPSQPYSGQYMPVIWESSKAKMIRVNVAAQDTVEAAVRAAA